jgi:serine/threonine protein phosphatase 1
MFAGESSVDASTPEGQVIYAIGDIHGRTDLLDQILAHISKDISESEDARTTLIFLGDYVDRGPDPRGVIETLKTLKAEAGDRVVALRGNHEQTLLDFLADPARGAAWIEYGGRETLLSYGVVLPQRPAEDDFSEAQAAFAAALPQDHLSFLQALGFSERRGDYLFVHAGVRPGVSLDNQSPHDLMWIREEFLGAALSGDLTVVHGHTPVEAPETLRGRIGIDTGAYATGILTAVKLKDRERSFLRTGA